LFGCHAALHEPIEPHQARFQPARSTMRRKGRDSDCPCIGTKPTRKEGRMTDHLRRAPRRLCPPVGLGAGVARVILVVVLGAGVPASATITSPSPEAMALNRVYFTALLSGRDPDAAVRKARYTAQILMQNLGMPRSAALADVTQFALRRGGVLCGGP
jgi:hypothetical protein